VTTHELIDGVPLFLSHLCDILGQEAPHVTPRDELEMGKRVARHGDELRAQGFSIAQVVNDYSDTCRAVVDLTFALRRHLGLDGLNTLNRCLDKAIAHAVTEYARHWDITASVAQIRQQGVFPNQHHNRVHAAMLAFEAVKSGGVGVAGRTVQVLDRSLRGLRELIDRTAPEVGLVPGLLPTERLRLLKFEDVEVNADPLRTPHTLGTGLAAQPHSSELRRQVSR